MEGMCGAIVKQVGGFSCTADWDKFPFKGQGGVALDCPSDVYFIPGLKIENFDAGDVWWMLLEFPW